ncbi:MAG TPA: ABC transporter substrate-binding protein [Xanthobacteraceae bacterium]|nr:ABC transporter substrate-binding protein [Xanthobacteraceae bacterium]
MQRRTSFLRAAAAIAVAIAATVSPAAAQETAHPWLLPDLLTAAKSEAALTVYGSMNEQEALPLWKLFEDATGVKVSYVRSSDTQIMARVAIENRAGQHSWDVAFTTTVPQLPPAFLAPFDPPQANGLMAEARDPNRRWYGGYANYNAPAYNTQFVNKADLPKSPDEFAGHKEWAGKIAIDGTDDEWLAAICAYYGDERGRANVKSIVAALDPIVTDGHLALARSVGAGEYWLALNNFLPLTLNVKMSGAPTDFWLMEPVPLIFGSVGVNVLAPHPNAARLAGNFVLSQEAETFMTHKGRLPTRPDVPTDPPEIGAMLKASKIMPVVFNGDDQRKWQKTYNELFGRP